VSGVTGSQDAGLTEREAGGIRLSNFNRLWLGQAVSSAGSQVTTLALPLTAVLYLHATAFQMGILNAAQELAFLGPMLLFGVLVDWMRRRPLVIGTDLGRGRIRQPHRPFFQVRFSYTS
jgi:MFS family permease